MGSGKPSAQNPANPIHWGNAVSRSRSLPWPSLSHGSPTGSHQMHKLLTDRSGFYHPRRSEPLTVSCFVDTPLSSAARFMARRVSKSGASMNTT